MTSGALTSAAGVCIAAMLAGLVVAAVGYRLGMLGPWVGGSVAAGLASFAGAYTLGRAHQEAKHERNPR